MPTPTLPSEIIDCILYEVESNQSFKACSLVCSSWRYLSQKHLFKHITITHSPRKHCIDFVKCVAQGDTNAVRLAQHIQFLCLSDCESDYCFFADDPYLLDRELLDELQLIEDCTILFLNQLQIIRGLNLYLSNSWDNMGQAGNRALLRLFQLPSLKTIELNFIYGTPISLLHILGGNIQAVCIRGIGLSSEGIELEKALIKSRRGRQAERRSEPMSFDMLGFRDFEALMSSQFKNENPTFFASLHVVSVHTSEWDKWDTESQMQHLRTFLDLCPRLSKFTIGELMEPYSEGLEFVVDSTPISSNNQHVGCRATLSIWIEARDDSRGYIHDDCKTFTEFAHLLLRKLLSRSTQNSPAYPLDSPSSANPLDLSEVLTSLTLNYHIRSAPYCTDDPTDITRPYSNMWACMDKFLVKHFRALQALSVNIDLYFSKDHDTVQPKSIVQEAENSFPQMSSTPYKDFEEEGELGEKKRGFEKIVKSSIWDLSLY